MKKLAIIAAVALLAACNSGNGTSARARIPKQFQFLGSYKISGVNNVGGDLSQCRGAGEFADVAVGTPVTVAKFTGKPIAVGHVEVGLGTNIYQSTLDECTFRFSVANVPRAKSYLITVGRHGPTAIPLATVVAGRGIVVINANPPPSALPPSPVPVGG
jgi:hypothetical protein